MALIVSEGYADQNASADNAFMTCVDQYPDMTVNGDGVWDWMMSM